MAMSLGTSDGNYLMVCAIDLGTTFSGYAFAFKGEEKKILMNKNWGEAQGYQSYKTPTSVLTGPNNKCIAFGYEAESEYCHKLQDFQDGYNLFKYFKMLLHMNPNLSKSTQVKSITGKSLAAFDIFVFMVKSLKKHCLDAIQKSDVEKPTPDMIRWVLTVPAIWSDTAKDFMRQVAYKAGLIKSKDSDQLVLALEPEAAALYCKETPIRAFGPKNVAESRMNVAKNDKYLVIDAGGGTVDITGYKVLDNGKIEELIVANGGPWGGITVDNHFKKLLNQALGETFMKEFEKKYPLDFFNLMNDFERSKRGIKGEMDNEKIVIRVSYNLGQLYFEKQKTSIEKQVNEKKIPGVVFSNGAIVIKKDKACELYVLTVNTIAEHVIKLFEDPMLKGLSYMMLVGGFGESPILQQGIRHVIPEECKLIVPSEAQLSVIKGAIYFGFNLGEIKSRLPRKTYGADVMRWFTPGRHDEKRKFVHNGKEWCDGLFEPFVIKGETIEYGKSIIKRRTPVINHQEYMTIDIFCTDRTNFDEEAYVDDPDMQRLGQIYIDMPNVEKNFDRVVLVEFWFGGTEIKVTATDQSSGKKATTRIDFCVDY